MRIVICDDHRLFLEALATALAKRGYTVEAATTSPDEALTAVALHDPDVLLIDVTFPMASGIDAARRLKTQHPRTKVVLITGSDSAEHLSEALETGVSGYLLKSQRVEAICNALELAARGELALDWALLRRLKHAGKVPKQRSAVHELTPREQHVLNLLRSGMDTGMIVRDLGVSESTVRTHIQNILNKLGVHSRLQAVAAVADGPLEDPGTSHGRFG